MVAIHNGKIINYEPNLLKNADASESELSELLSARTDRHGFTKYTMLANIVFTARYSEEDGEWVATCSEYKYLTGFGMTAALAIEDLSLIILKVQEIEEDDRAS